MITSPQNEKVKWVKALQTTARTRRKEGKIVLEGSRLVGDALRAGYIPGWVWATADWADEALQAALRQAGVEITPVSEAVMRHMSDTEQPQGILGVFDRPAAALPPRLHHVLILDAIRDPGNLGTILRTAAAAGVDGVLLSPTCADPYNPKVLRSGMGAHFRVPLAEAAWAEVSRLCDGMTVYLAAGEGESRYDEVDWRGGWALIVGSEAHGAGDDARRLAQRHIRIPMAGETESLNAAVAAGILLFEAKRAYEKDSARS